MIKRGGSAESVAGAVDKLAGPAEVRLQKALRTTRLPIIRYQQKNPGLPLQTEIEQLMRRLVQGARAPHSAISAEILLMWSCYSRRNMLRINHMRARQRATAASPEPVLRLLASDILRVVVSSNGEHPMLGRGDRTPRIACRWIRGDERTKRAVFKDLIIYLKEPSDPDILYRRRSPEEMKNFRKKVVHRNWEDHYEG